MGAEHVPRPAPLLPHEMEHIRKVYDEDVSSKKFASIISPREELSTLEGLGVTSMVFSIFLGDFRYRHGETDLYP